MPRIPFQKPKKVEWEILSDRYGRLVAEPFEKGYALTVGNSLRRTLLAVVPGAAVSWVRIDGVKNVETKMRDTLKQAQTRFNEMAAKLKGMEKVTWMHLESVMPQCRAADPAGSRYELIRQPRNTVIYEAAGKKASPVPAGAIPLDAAYSPITRVSYNIEMSRLGKITDYEKLILEVWTNGSVSPDDALTRASTYLKQHWSPLAAGATEEDEEAAAASGEAFLRDALAKTLEELALPARAINALKNADINLVVDLVQKSEGDLEHVKNLGEKSIDEIKTALAALGLSLGMRIDPNVLGALGRGGVPR